MSKRRTGATLARLVSRPIDPRTRRVHRTLYAAIAIAIAAGIAFMISIAAQTLDGEIAPSEMAKTLGQDPYNSVVIDTRSTAEWEAGHVPFSMSIPLDQLGRRFSELAGLKDRQLIVIDESEEREKNGATLLTRNGFRTVVTAKGGLPAWRADGRALVTANDAPIHKMVQ